MWLSGRLDELKEGCLFQSIHSSVFKLAILGLFFVHFRLFKQPLQFLQQLNVKKCPSSLRCLDSNSQSSEHKFPPLTTRPGLLPLIRVLSKVYRDKVAPSELWTSIILVMSFVNFYLVGLCTKSDFTPSNCWTSVAIFTKNSECFLITKR